MTHGNENGTDHGSPSDDGPGRPVTERLEEVLADTERTIAELRAELAAARRREAQHEAVEQLEEHLAAATVRWADVRAFFQQVLDELRGNRQEDEG